MNSLITEKNLKNINEIKFVVLEVSERKSTENTVLPFLRAYMTVDSCHTLRQFVLQQQFRPVPGICTHS